jgi:hypothetical protein
VAVRRVVSRGNPASQSEDMVSATCAMAADRAGVDFKYQFKFG